MLGQLTSLTGGGGLSVSSSAKSGTDGDQYFNNGDFNFKSGGDNGNQIDTKTIAIIAAVGLAAYLVIKRR